MRNRSKQKYFNVPLNRIYSLLQNPRFIHHFENVKTSTIKYHEEDLISVTHDYLIGSVCWKIVSADRSFHKRVLLIVHDPDESIIVKINDGSRYIDTCASTYLDPSEWWHSHTAVFPYCNKITWSRKYRLWKKK